MENLCTCPQCGSKAFKRNGYTRHGKQNHRCLDCGRQFSFSSLDIENVATTTVMERMLIDELTIQNVC